DRDASGTVSAQAEALRPRGLDGDVARFHAEGRREVRPHLVAARRDDGSLGDHRDVARSEGPPGARDDPGDTAEELQAADALRRRVVVGEVRPEIAQRRRAEHRLREGMTHDVGIGVSAEPGLAVEADACEEERTLLLARVDVESEPDPRLGHPSCIRAIARASSRSRGVVILRLSRSPGTVRIAPPAHSTSAASSVNPADSRTARSCAPSSGPNRNACGVWTRTRSSRDTVSSTRSPFTRFTVSATGRAGTTPTASPSAPATESNKPCDANGRAAS